MAEGNKVMSALLGVVALCSLVAIIISAITLSRPSQVPTITLGNLGGSSGGSSNQQPIVIQQSPQGGSSGGGLCPADKIWLVTLGHDWGPHEYLDDYGTIQGLSTDIINAVCQAAQMKCRLVWDKYTNCWKSEAGKHPSGGTGLHGKYYDACTGWSITTARVQTFDFTMAFFKPDINYLWVKSGDTTFNAKDITGKKIGFMDGWSADVKCLARQTQIKGSVLPKEQIIHFAEKTDLIKGLIDGKVDAVLSSPNNMHQWINSSTIQQAGDAFTCKLDGSSMMTRKDNNFVTCWNAGFTAIKSNGIFRKICEEAKDKHGHKGDALQCIV